jgi:hypothetical protein
MIHKVKLAYLSLPGRKHRDKGLPNEDACVASSGNGVSVICVSDGAGGSQYTYAEIGAKSIVKTVSELMINHFDAFYQDVRENVVRSIIITAIQSELAILANENGIVSLEKLSATMMFCAVKDSRMICGHIGDGLIAKVSVAGIVPLTIPQNGEDSTSTFFATFPDAQDYLRIIKTTTDDAHAIVLMTDGLSDMVYNSSSFLVRPVVAALAELAGLPDEEIEPQLKEAILKHVIDSSPLSDDATIGIVYFCDTEIPDAGQLISEKPIPSIDYKDVMRKVQLELLPRVKLARSIVSQSGIPLDTGGTPSEKFANAEESIESSNNKKLNSKADTNISAKKRWPKRIHLFCLLGLVSIVVLIAVIINIL